MALMVASIDFGTTFSGWAYSLRHDFRREPTKISCRQWIAAPLISNKAPTCVLIKSDGRTFHSFGYDAEQKYADLAGEGDHAEWYYFKRFKMRLFDKKTLSKETELEDESGKKLAALTVFSLCIEYLRKDLMTTVESQTTGDTWKDKDVLYVLTVPAIWNDAAKQFMREAAELAGIKRDKLVLALEPESASLLCRYLQTQKTDDEITPFQPGTKYLVVDAGGGTVDVTVHQVTDDNKIAEVHKASGGAWGGTKVDEAFEKLLDELTAEHGVVTALKTRHMESYVDLSHDFEVRKREIRGAEIGFNIRLPTCFIELTREFTGTDLKVNIAKSRYKDRVKFAGDKLKLSAGVTRALFDLPLKKIVSHVTSLLGKPNIRDCSMVIMVGGFSESALLQEEMRMRFPGLKIIVPQDAGLAVLKGAVLFGHDRSAITQRVLKYTYGTRISHTTDESCAEDHPPCEQRLDNHGIMICHGLVRVHVRAGEAVKFGEEQPEKICIPVNDDQNGIRGDILVSTDLNPKLASECQKIGRWCMPIPDTSLGTKRRFGETFIFGGTEVQLKVVDKTSGETRRENVNFLG